MEEKKLVYLMANVEKDGNNHRALILHAVTMAEDDTPRNMSSDWAYQELPYKYELNDLEFKCVWNEYSNDPLMGHWQQLAYQRCYGLEVPRLERMAKTLKSIITKLNKMNDSDGPVLSFAQYALRFAKAIGAKGLVIKTSGNSTWYNENQYRVVTGADMAWEVKQLCEKCASEVVLRVREDSYA